MTVARWRGVPAYARETWARYFRYNRPKRASRISNAGSSPIRSGLLGTAWSWAADVEQIEVNGTIWPVREIVREQRMTIPAATVELNQKHSGRSRCRSIRLNGCWWRST